LKRVRILNGSFDPITLHDTATFVREAIATGRRGVICTVNVAMLMMMRRDATLRRVVESSALTVADGQPIVWVSRLFGKKLPERVAGVELISVLAALAAREQFPIYLLGARRDVVDEVACRLTNRYSGLEIAGVADGYFSEHEAVARADAVRTSGAKLLIVAMGVPRQEAFLDEHFESCGATVALPVGGGFEVIAGKRVRAPGWIRKLGLEWLFRLAQEPRRLFKRYLVTNTQFIALTLWALATGEGRRRNRAVEDATNDSEHRA
jgi:N-acetylglucosaminyldiphosphoundecaprenol N-acetyl-beta-D-mannosaminyltransferase